MTVNISPLQVLLVTLAGWVNRHQQHVIEYLLAENRVLKGQLTGRRLRLTDDERRRLAAKGRRLGRRLLRQVATIVTPDTIWHRQLIARKRTFEPKRARVRRGQTGWLLGRQKYRPVAEWTVKEHAHPALITPEVAAKVQGRLRQIGVTERRGTAYLLSGILVCGLCGQHYVGSKAGGRHVYRCLARCKRGQRACSNNDISRETVESFASRSSSRNCSKKAASPIWSRGFNVARSRSGGGRSSKTPRGFDRSWRRSTGSFRRSWSSTPRRSSTSRSSGR